MMRPSKPAPTGTEIGAPVSVTSWPRTRPSLVSIATVRTVFSPSCCATSSTSRLPWLKVSSAFKIGGRSPSKCTSTTAPMTWVICPTKFAIMALLSDYSAECSLHSFRAGNDLDQLFRDHRLAGAVVGERLPADHIAGVAGCVVHGRHLRTVERSRVFLQ